MKIRTKFILFIVLPILLIYIGVAVFNTMSNYKKVRELSEAKFLADTQALAAQIGRENAYSVAVAKATATGAEMLFGNRSASTRLIKNQLLQFPEFVGASVSYTVNADFNDGRSELGLRNLIDGKPPTDNTGIDAYDFKENKTNASIEEWIAKSKGGRFITYWARENGELVLEPLHGFDNAMYAAGMRKKFEGGDKEHFLITEPNFYKGKVLMVEYASPIVNKGKYAGQVAFDRDLSDIAKLLENLNTLKKSQMYLISTQGRIIASTKNENLRTISIDDLYTDEYGSFVVNFFVDENGQLVRNEAEAEKLDLSKLKTVYRDLLRNAFDASKNMQVLDRVDPKVGHFIDPQSSVHYCMASTLVQPGNWVLVQMIPESEIFQPLYSMIFRDVAGLLIMTAVMSIGMAFVNGITRRVNRALGWAERISRGNFDIDASRYSENGDETGALMVAMEKMSGSLRAGISAIRETGAVLDASSAEIEKASLEYESGIRSFEVSSGAVTSAFSQFSDAGEYLVKAVDSATESASNSYYAATEGKKRMIAMEGVLRSLSESSSAVMRKLSIMREKADTIEATVASITKVADQTNLLSLNASIEAEKAGQQGVGFAVIAQEIGRLAQQTAMSIMDMENVVKDMKVSVNSGMNELDSFSKQVRGSVGELERVMDDVDGIIAATQAISPQMDKLSEGMKNQSSGVIQISDSMSDLYSGVRKAASLLAGLSNARQQLRAAVEKLRHEIAGINSDGDGK